MPALSTVEMHTGGEPVRIVTAGFPIVNGDTILDKRRTAAEQHDDLRRLLMLEPRGHYDMYGVLPVEPDDPDADLAVLFMHNEGWSTMCGHATLALGRWAVDTGLVPATPPITTVRLQVPAGLVEVDVEGEPGATSGTRYRSTPSFLALRELAISLDGTEVLVDVAYGGAFYALVAAPTIGVDLDTATANELRSRGTAVTSAVGAVAELQHPDADDLGFLCGTIITDGVDEGPSRNVCVFAEAQIDRSPTGSGVQARMAQRFARGLVGAGEKQVFRSIVGSEFTGEVIAEATVGSHDAVVVEVGGRSFYTGAARFDVEEGDELLGFSVREASSPP